MTRLVSRILLKDTLRTFFQAMVDILTPLSLTYLKGLMVFITFPFGTFQKEEFHNAFFQMHSDKSLGPEGFNYPFYKHLWNILSNDIFLKAMTWLHQGTFPSSLNKKDIVLIPKKYNPTFMLDYRPISLCSVLYKIVFKV